MEGLCRGCLNKFHEPTDLLQYCESYRRLFVYSTGLQVKRNDTFTFQLCKECFLNMKLACQFKKKCRYSDKMIKNYLVLKEDGDGVDFCTYHKNARDTFSTRLPIISRNSTPRHQRNDEDDNESTCTSIQNFMTDMLEGEEMPPAEDRIIREVIQEEADILDDSLDSHWLQEDMSIDNDFQMDFNFAMSTPRSINNDHCYTPRRLSDDKVQELNYYTSKNIIQRCDDKQNDMPNLDDCGLKFDNSAARNVGDLESEYSIIEPSITHNNDMPILDDCDIELDGDVDNDITLGGLETSFCVDNIEETDKEGGNFSVNEKLQNRDSFVQRKVPKINSEGDLYAKIESFKDSLFSPFAISEKVSMTNEKNSEDFMNKLEFKKPNNDDISDIDKNKELRNEKQICVNLNQDTADKTMNQSPFTQELEKYISKSALKTAIGLKSLDGKELSVYKTGEVYKNGVQQKGKDICVILNPDKNIKKLEDASINRELELYINKVELKKKTKQVLDPTTNINDVNEEQCIIDRNLKIALKNDDRQEFSLDQLLVSSQVSLRSGASTPTINNILFGGTTPKDKDTDVTQKLEGTVNVQETDSKDFEDVFLKFVNCNLSQEIEDKTCKQVTENDINITSKLEDAVKIQDDCQHFDDCSSSSSSKGFKDRAEIEQLQKCNEKNKFVLKKTKSKKWGRIAVKDIRKLRELVQFEHDDSDELSESDHESLKDEQIHKKEIGEKSVSNEDLEVLSVTNLLNFDDNQSVDLNFSISSDFLKETEELGGSDIEEKEQSEDIFKRPFSPPDTKYDIYQLLCKICNKKYRSKKTLKEHLVNKHKLKIEPRRKNHQPKICHFCGKSFRDKSNLNKHIKTHDGPDMDIFECDYCTLTFESRGRLSQHMRAHSSKINSKEEDKERKNRFVCSTCGKVFTLKGNYKVHLRRHTKSYTESCNLCEKQFYRKEDLRLHMGSHTSEYTFACKLCPKVYRRRDLLMGHMYRHLDLKDFECEVCNVKFVAKHLLERHYNSKLCIQNREKAKISDRTQFDEDRIEDMETTSSEILGQDEIDSRSEASTPEATEESENPAMCMS